MFTLAPLAPTLMALSQSDSQQSVIPAPGNSSAHREYSALHICSCHVKKHIDRDSQLLCRGDLTVSWRVGLFIVGNCIEETDTMIHLRKYRTQRAFRISDQTITVLIIAMIYFGLQLHDLMGGYSLLNLKKIPLYVVFHLHLLCPSNIFMLTPLHIPHKFDFNIDTKICHIEPLVAEIHSIHFGHVLFKQGPEKSPGFNR